MEKLELVHDKIAELLSKRISEEDKLVRRLKDKIARNIEEGQQKNKFIALDEDDLEEVRRIKNNDLLSEEEWLFVEDSRRLHLKVKRRTRMIWTLVGIVIVVFGAFGTWNYIRANQKEKDLVQKELEVKDLIEKLPETIMRKASDEKRWSEYQGIMNWDEAVKKCKSLGMRLPTRLEWQGMYQYNLEKFMELDHSSFYWTSEEYSSDSVYSFRIDYGSITILKNYYIINVRCIR